MAAVIAAQRHQERPPAINSSAPLPQATVSVLEFRCTYTREGYKKAPKFHDGTITYHTFNKVIVLYDDTRRVITNHHYRGDEDVDEGVRLSFDRSILVDVAEPAGETQTDLNQVLRQRHSPEKPAYNATRHVRANAVVSQAKPKSLRDVLGASQGPIGRARQHPQTPYEQRQIHEALHSDQPLLKRLKVGAGKENLPLKEPFRLPSPPQPGPRPCTQEICPTWQPKQLGIAQEMHELSSDEEVLQPIPPPRQRKKDNDSPSRRHQRMKTPTPSAHDVSARRPLTKTFSHETQEASSVQKLKGPIAETINLDAQPPTVRVSLDSLKTTPRVYNPRPGTSQLQLSKQPPRRKLMYRSLLSAPNADAAPPRTRTPSHTSQSPSRTGHSPQALHDTGSGRAVEQVDLPDPDPAAAGRFNISTRPNSNNADQNVSETSPPQQIDLRGSVDTAIDISSSPMFVSQDGQRSPCTSQHIESSQDFEVHILQATKTIQPGESIDHPISLSPRPSPVRPSEPHHGPFLDEYDRNEDSESFQSAPPKSTQEQMPPPPRPAGLTSPKHPSIVPRPPTPRLQSTPCKRPFRRVLSENDAFPSPTKTHILTTIDDEEPFPFLLPDTDFPPTAAVLHPCSTPQRPALRRRTLSDPVMQPVDTNAATTLPITSVNVEPVAEEPKGEGETGPWTTVEAWLLFDLETWPQELRKRLPEWIVRSEARQLGGSLIGRERGGGENGAGTRVAGAANLAGGFSSAKGLWYEHTAQGTGILRDEAGAL